MSDGTLLGRIQRARQERRKRACRLRDRLPIRAFAKTTCATPICVRASVIASQSIIASKYITLKIYLNVSVIEIFWPEIALFLTRSIGVPGALSSLRWEAIVFQFVHKMIEVYFEFLYFVFSIICLVQLVVL